VKGRQGKIQSISLSKGIVYPHIIPNLHDFLDIKDDVLKNSFNCFCSYNVNNELHFIIWSKYIYYIYIVMKL